LTPTVQRYEILRCLFIAVTLPAICDRYVT